MKNNIKSAFTIVELLVVMAVIGILISLAVVGIQAIQKSQRETTRANDVKNLVASLAEYYGKYRTYPGTLDDSSSELKLDNVGGNQGVCLFKPGQGTDSSSQNGDGDCDVETESGSGLYSILKFGQLNMVIGLADLTSVLHSTYVCADVEMTADLWRIVYANRGSGNSTQAYGLWYCSENGKSINFGESYN